MEWQEVSYDRWTKSHVSFWLRFIGIEETYIKKLKKKKVTGAVLKTLHRDFLSNTIGMTSVQTEHLLRKRDELLESGQESNLSSQEPCDAAEQGNIPTECNDVLPSSGEALFCEFRKFDQNEKDCRYVKHNLLPPETGSDDMLVPCHEYKSFDKEHKKRSEILQANVAIELLRFACACMNMRANGTIHFGIMDKVKGTHKHGEIIGIPVKCREDFVDALNHIELCFDGINQQSDARSCIRNPQFIEVLDKKTTEKTWVIEYDIVPKATIVKGETYRVGLPTFNREGNVTHEGMKISYCRAGTSTEEILYRDLAIFSEGLKQKDQQREEAEASNNKTPQDFREDQKRKLCILLTCGTGRMDNSLYYIVVTNKIRLENLDSIDFMVNMKPFCVFDFDPDSKTSGLCGTYKKQEPANLHFLKDYANDSRLERSDFIKSLQLFDKTSWIFCNGRSDLPGGEQTCDEKTWIRTRQKELKKAVSVICNDILPRRSFVVLFLLMSDVEQPLVETFHEFYAEMTGHHCLTVLSESKENSKKFTSLAQVWCPTSTLKDISVEMPLSHVDATVQSIQLSKNKPTRTLPVFSGGQCFLKSVEEATLDSLEIISIDQCDETKLENMTKEEIQQTDIYFYRGGKIEWINLWLADKRKCGDVIKRDAYKEASTILDNIVPKPRRPIETVIIYHHPGSGGSTVARQILWDRRNKVRCAVVKQGKEITTVCEHAVKLREHDENDKNNCLPVLLLLDNHNADYIDELRGQLGNVIATTKINSSVLCFILLICNRSNDPERLCRASPSQTVAVTHKLSDEEKPLFSEKLEQLQLENETDFILTFVLMSKEFESSYIKDFVRNLLEKTDHSSPITRLIRFVALLNSYVDDSYISVSHCEAYLGIRVFVDSARHHAFVEDLTEEAKLILIHLRQSSTHIQSIKIIHPLVAKELLHQLSAKVPQSETAMDLITDKVLVNHRFDQDTFLKFIKDLFIRRNKKSRGDVADTAFSPFIEHVTKECDVQKAVDLMKAAFGALTKDAYVAQQLARLLYTNLRFQEALHWAEEAKSLLPHDTFVLDTLGQVYKWWFYHLFDNLGQEEPSPEMGAEVISIALKGIRAFHASEKTSTKENVTLNSSYYGEVDVGCRLLKFLSVVDVFSNDTGKSELMRYLLTEYIPAEVHKPWQDFHHQLKGLQRNLSHALECISEDLSYFQIDISEEDEELDARDPEQLYNPRKWLTRKSAVYAGYFCNIPEESEAAESNSGDLVSTAEKLSSFQRQMRIHELGGGNVASILNLHYDKKPQNAGRKLETIINMYQEHQTWKNLDQVELTKFIFCQIALNCILPGSSKLLSLQELQELSKRFITRGRNMSSASALFVLSLLFWPETSNELSSSDAKTLSSAIDELQRLWELKIQRVTPRKSRTATHFYLAKPRGLNKIVHKSAIEKHIKGTLNDRQLKWRGGEVWKTKEVMQRLKRVEGWTENGKLFVKVGGDRRIRVIPRYSASLPNGNENVTFYLGFSFDGVGAFDIQVTE